MSQLQTTQKPTLINVVAGMKDQIAAALPKHISADRIVRIAMTTLRQNKRLAQCNQDSFLGALIVGSQLGLEPNTPLGQCYLIPYGNECQFQIGYKGLIDLCYRSGMYARIFSGAVYENDEYNFEHGASPICYHKPVFPQKGKPILYYAGYTTKDGQTEFEVWDTDKIVEHAKKYSKSYNGKSSPWQTSFDAMAKKTVLIDALRMAQKSIEMAQAEKSDNAILKLDNESLAAGQIDIDTTFDEAELTEITIADHQELLEI